MKKTLLAIVSLLWGHAAFALLPHSVKHIMVIVLENTDYADAIKQPFLADFAAKGALLSNFDAESHPSQGNYIALVAGQKFGVDESGKYDIDGRSIADLIEEAGKSWKTYAEAYPGKCFQGLEGKTYARRHNPLISFKNIQQNPGRCQNIVNASQLNKDISSQTLPSFSLYIPDLNNDGHDTSVAFADKWFRENFEKRLSDPKFMKGMLVIVTFDESGTSKRNQVYTALRGEGVRRGSVGTAHYNHYSLLRTIEELLGLKSLDKNDKKSPVIKDIWN